MQIKYLARKLGRKIKSMTDIPHPIAMRIGKLIATNREYDIQFKFPQYSQMVTTCNCCGGYLWLGTEKGMQMKVSDIKY